MKRQVCLLVGLVLAGSVTVGSGWAYNIFPFQNIGPAEDFANGVQYYWNYPGNPRLFITTEEGFHSYDFATEQWTDRTWPGWFGKALSAVVPVPDQPGHLALGGVNAFFKGVLKLSTDDGATDEVVYQSTGGRVIDMALALWDEPAIFACTWSDVADGELLRSDDGGASFDPILGHGHHDLTGVEAISGTEIYVSGDNYVSRTLDGGQTWDNLQGNLPAGEGMIYNLLAPQPVSGLPDKRVAEGHKDEPYINAGFLMICNASGVYTTSAHEIDWQLILPESCRSVAYRFMQSDTFLYWSEYYAVTFDGRLLVCLNQDWDNWVDATEMIAPAEPIEVISEQGPVYVATRSHGVYVSAGIDGLSPTPPPAPKLSLSARPNPFNPVTELLFNVPREGNVIIQVFDLSGRKVADVHEGRLPAGPHSLSWQPRGLSSGVYHAVLREGGLRATVRITLVK